MNIEEAIETVRNLDIDRDEESLIFKAAVILFFGMTNETVNIQRIKANTNYCWKEVYFIMNNFRANLAIVCNNWEVPIGEDDLENLVEITCLSMAGAGELVRIAPNAIMPEEKSFTWSEYSKRMRHCPSVNVSRDFLYKNFGIGKKRVPKIKNQIPEEEDETPIWLLEKQEKIKARAEKFDKQNE